MTKKEVIDKLWDKYLSKRDKFTRDKLLVEYADLVKYLALHVSYGLPNHIEIDDLISVGMLGLVKAVEKFSRDYDNKFETYATFKIRGAILDYLRECDWISRRDRQRIKNMNKAYQVLEGKLSRTPYDKEVADYLNIDADEYREWTSTVAPIVFSIDKPVGTSSDGGGIKVEDILEDKKNENPLKKMEKLEVKEIIKVAINELKEKERLIIALYHFEELNLKEIGKVLDISESRVSQIHTTALTKLKAKVRNKMRAV